MSEYVLKTTVFHKAPLLYKVLMGEDSEAANDRAQYDEAYFLGDRARKSPPRLLKRIISGISEMSERNVSAPSRAGIIDRLIGELGLTPNHAKVLDVGAGRFHLREALRKLGVNNVFGVDFVSHGFEITKENERGGGTEQTSTVDFRAVVGNALRLPLATNSVDIAFCSDVGEHLGNDGNAGRMLDELGRVAERAIVFQVTPTDYGKYYYIDKTHNLPHTTEEWQNMLLTWGENHGWKITEAHWVSQPPAGVRQEKHPLPNPPTWVLVKNDNKLV